ncbi:hypothetical protein JSQ81_07580 [Sporosarcina sp. Marseille-Q4063]|uniref:hypothetical protein n=1 Tax=Sporosarcina sp. Marseille-Q4063 TaxID=2810514 RepID=UPI001BAF701D|nr:hypothetical protein [Sporosarcina sp. Marseille-Q4063]QUW23374.1 hypothetical protein JSQ81_07580 [Sporosarcina sp. Marseille-Q4063]
MKKIIVISLLTLGLLVGCQSSSLNNDATSDTGAVRPQGLVQLDTAIESTDINTVLRELHTRGMTIIDIKLREARDVTGTNRTVYDIMYEEPSADN